MSSPSVLYVDCRCLQDSAFNANPTQPHAEVLLRTRHYSAFRSVTSVGVIDESLGRLPAHITDMFDCVTANPQSVTTDGDAVLIDLSPLTQTPLFPDRRIFQKRLFTAAVVYDFVPLQWRWRSNLVKDRIRYCSQLFRLKEASLFFPVSAWTAQCLNRIAGIPEHAMRVTGTGIPSSVFEARERYLQCASAVVSDRRPFFLVAGSSDSRGNEMAVIRAVRTLNQRRHESYEIAVIGQPEESYKRELLNAASTDVSVVFHATPSTDDVVHLYSSALAAICPAHVEGFCGFSLEASVCETPVIASASPAHAEFFPYLDTLFPSSDPDVLAVRLNRIFEDPAWRSEIVWPTDQWPGTFMRRSSATVSGNLSSRPRLADKSSARKLWHPGAV